jgi:hypothetical protein
MWVLLDDAIAQHPKFLHAGPEALALFVAGLCYCNRYGTEGSLPKPMVPHLLPGLGEGRAMELATRLAANGQRPSWTDAGDHFQVHDYDLYQPPAPQEDRDRQRRARNAERQRRFRERQAAAGEPWQAAEAEPDPRYVTRNVTHNVTRDRNAPVTRYRNAAPLPGPLPFSKDFTISIAGEEEQQQQQQQARRARNAERQRRYRQRQAALELRYVTRDVTPRNVTPRNVTRYVTPGRNAADVPELDSAMLPGIRPAHWPAAPAGGRPVPCRREIPPSVTVDDRQQLKREQNAERQRRHRDRQAAAPPPATATATATAARERDADFRAWFAAYPRQEGEVPARRAWLAERDLPPLAQLLERLALQREAKPDARYWLAPERYLRERRWTDQPPPAARNPQFRSAAAEIRALGSDESRRQRLREISAAAYFDPHAPRAGAAEAAKARDPGPPPATDPETAAARPPQPPNAPGPEQPDARDPRPPAAGQPQAATARDRRPWGARDPEGADDAPEPQAPNALDHPQAPDSRHSQPPHRPDPEPSDA